MKTYTRACMFLTPNSCIPVEYLQQKRMFKPITTVNFTSP